jgi:hypothetical protein
MTWVVFVMLEIAEMCECGALRELRKENYAKNIDL